MHPTLQPQRRIARFLLPTLLLPVLATSAQAYESKYRGSSTFWNPDYAGTLQMSRTGQLNFTAIADVELQVEPSMLPNPDSFRYEMRGLITLTSPVTLIGNNGETTTCTPVSSVPVRIEYSGMNILKANDQIPSDRYSLSIYQDVRIPSCVTASGQVIDQPNATIEINFDSNALSTADAEAEAAADAATPVYTLSEADRAATEQAAVAAQQVFGDDSPALQALRAREAEFMRTGRPMTEAEVMAWAEQLQADPALANLPSLSPEAIAAAAAETATPTAIDARMRPLTNINHLQDQTSINQAGEQYTFSWDLRRVR
ncbi:MAG: hypothetical protein MUF49_06095 [Oculatellaceae cyanobacterium Prado106]|jgi:hypothetical protein|nr:hypothetical protein [Oculatellaceae cyanobacterium Prado106]